MDQPTGHTMNGPQCQVAREHNGPMAPQQMICYQVSNQLIGQNVDHH